MAGASRCGASQVETIPSGSVVGQDGADSLEVSAHMFYHMYRQEDPSTVEVKDQDEPLELEDQRIVLLNEWRAVSLLWGRLAKGIVIPDSTEAFPRTLEEHLARQKRWSSNWGGEVWPRP